MVLLGIITRQYRRHSLSLEVLLAASVHLDAHEFAFYQLDDELASAKDEAIFECLQLSIVSARKRVGLQEDLREYRHEQLGLFEVALCDVYGVL